MRELFSLLLVTTWFTGFSQQNPAGVLTGNIVDEKKAALENATAQLVSLRDSAIRFTSVTDKTGEFSFQPVSFGYYQLRISYVGLQPLFIDSIHFRQERSDFQLTDLLLKPKTSDNLQEVIVYSEKPLLESKDGNLIFNAGESALAAGSNASELLTNIPLITKDVDGKIAVRGKEPKILIDDKPVELNQQRLQDLLESMPGSSIEKIEVMTNPPPQYANEQGGVINIITRKGKVGRSGRISLTAGTRGEVNANANYSYRKQGLSFSINAGTGYSRYNGEGYSIRNNIYTDSSNFFNTRNNNVNRNLRPNLRVNMDYDVTKYQSLNVVFQLNSSDYNNQSFTEYKNINRFDELYRLSERNIRSNGDNYNGSLSVSYLLKTKKAGEQLRIIADANRSISNGKRVFYQQFFNPDYTPNGVDSTQEQLTDNGSQGYNMRINYDRPLVEKKTFLSTGTFITRNNSDVDVDASYFKKADNTYAALDALSNRFRFHQTIFNLRSSLRQMIGKDFSVTAGISAEQTSIWFELLKDNRDARNNYWTWLPFANLNKRWEDKLSLTFSWRRSIRRPGINELNPTIDFSDPYNVRFGNEKLRPSTADNFDLVIGRNQRLYFINIGAGYNRVKDIYSRVRTLLADGITQITWENISGRQEYEISTWGGVTLAKKVRANVSASYTFNQYSLFDRTFNRFRNGGSFTSNLSSTYTPKDILNFTGSFNFSRFANPQGFARWNWSMNLGAQRKFFEKRLTVTANVIDPFAQQRNRNFTYGPNFFVESFNRTNTASFRLSVAYNIVKPVKKKLPVLPGSNKR